MHYGGSVSDITNQVVHESYKSQNRCSYFAKDIVYESLVLVYDMKITRLLQSFFAIDGYINKKGGIHYERKEII